jgi:O-antigen ligase
MVWPINFYLAETVHDIIFVPVAGVLAAICLFFRRFKDGMIAKLLILFWGWVFLTRIVNGENRLPDCLFLVVPLAACFSFTAVGLSLKKPEREHFLNVLSIVTGLFYSVMGAICLFCMLSGKTILNPITGANLAQAAAEKKVVRLSLLDYHANMTAAVFFIPLSLMIYQFFHCRKWWWRIPASLVFLEFYLCIGLTYSRSNMAAVSVCLTLVVILLVLKRIPRKKAMCMLAVVLLTVLITPLAYKSFSWSTGAFGKAAATYRAQAESQEEKQGETDAAEMHTHTVVWTVAELKSGNNTKEEMTETAAAGDDSFGDNRNISQELKTLNNRLYLYKAVLVSFREEPIRMLIGSGDTEEMLYYANNVVQTKQHFVHMHNFLLQVLMMTGIPGFLLVAVICIYLLVRMIRLYFSESAGLAEKTLVLPMVGLFIHFTLEAGLFTSVDVRSLFFFLMAGMVIGTESTTETE